MVECLSNVNAADSVGMRLMLGRMLHFVLRVVRGLRGLFTRLIWVNVNRGVDISTWMRSHLLMMRESRFSLVRGFAVTRIV
jgi:hypothetical protein